MVTENPVQCQVTTPDGRGPGKTSVVRRSGSLWTGSELKMAHMRLRQRRWAGAGGREAAHDGTVKAVSKDMVVGS